jgi:hypothetical protein
MAERGANRQEVKETIGAGEHFEAKRGRIGFRRNFSFEGYRGEHWYDNKQLEVYTVQEPGAWLIITVLVKYF